MTYQVLLEGVVAGSASHEDLEAVRGVLGTMCRSISMGPVSDDSAWERMVRRPRRPFARRSPRLQEMLKAFAEYRSRQAEQSQTPWSADLLVEAADPQAAMDAGEIALAAAFASARDLKVVLNRAECKLGRRWLVEASEVRETLTPGRAFPI